MKRKRENDKIQKPPTKRNKKNTGFKFNVLQNIFSYLDIENITHIMIKGFNVDAFLDFKKNYLAIFNILIKQKKINYKSISNCILMGDDENLSINKIYFIDKQILKFYRKLNKIYSRMINYKHSNKVLILIGSFKCFKYKSLSINNKIIFLYCYFHKIRMINCQITENQHKQITKILISLAKSKISTDCKLILNTLLKLIPDCYISLFCGIIYNSNLVHIVHSSKKFIEKYLTKYPNHIYRMCVKSKLYQELLSVSIINWNVNLIPIIASREVDILYLIAEFFFNRNYKRQEHENTEFMNRIYSVIKSNKYNKYVEMIKTLF